MGLMTYLSKKLPDRKRRGMALTAEDPETTTKKYKENLEMANILTTYVCAGGCSGLWGGICTDVRNDREPLPRLW